MHYCLSCFIPDDLLFNTVLLVRHKSVVILSWILSWCLITWIDSVFIFEISEVCEYVSQDWNGSSLIYDLRFEDFC